MKTSEGGAEKEMDEKPVQKSEWQRPPAKAHDVTWSTHQLLQVVEQSKTLFVGDGREGIVGVNLLQAGHQVGQRVVGSKSVHLRGHTDRLVGLQFQEPQGTLNNLKDRGKLMFFNAFRRSLGLLKFPGPVSGSHRILQVLPASHGFELAELLTLQRPANHPLQINCVTLVQPGWDDRKF